MKKYIIYTGAEKDFALFANEVKEQYKQYDKIVIGISPNMQVDFKGKSIKVVRMSTVALMKQENIIDAISAFLRRKEMETADKMQLLVDKNEKLVLHNYEDIVTNGMISNKKMYWY